MASRLATLQRELTALRYVSVFAVLSMLYVAVCLSVRYPEHAASRSEIHLARASLSLPQSFTLTMFTFTSHMNVLSVYVELHNPLLGSMHVMDTVRNQQRRMNKVVFRATMLCLSLYTWVSLFGYLSFGRDVNDNIILAYPSGDKLILVARLAVSTALTLNSPLTVHPALSLLNSADADAAGSGGQGRLHRALSALVFIAAATVLAIVVPNISTVFSLVGATCTTVVSLVLPVALYVRLKPDSAPKLPSSAGLSPGGGREPLLEGRLRPMTWKHRLAVIFSCVMVAVSLVSIAMTVKDSVS